MQELYFDYYMRIAYSEPAARCFYTIKCIPAATDRQIVKQLSVEVEPLGTSEGSVKSGSEGIPEGSRNGKPVRGEDSFGNQLLYGSVDRVHEAFSFRARGLVRTGLADSEEMADEGRVMLYRHPSGLTRPGEGLRTYYESLERREGRSGYERAVFLMHRLYADFTYEKNVTCVDTTAEEAWTAGRGVCQDYAHILTALCRLDGIPARYVSGMMLGEGYSHAWVEIWTRGRWFSLDPTNDQAAGEDYIKIGNGRDAGDCMINRGIMTGGGRQTQLVRVKVCREPIP